MWNQVNEVLNELHQLSALSPKGLRTDFEKKVLRITNFLRWLSVGIMLVLIILLLVNFISSLQIFWRTTVLLLAIALMCIGMVSTLLDILPALAFLLLLNKQCFEIRQHESKHEFAQASQLQHHGLDALKLALIWIDLRVERMKLGLVFIVGGSDKVAIFALVGSGWTVWHNISATHPSWLQQISLYGAAFCGGLAIGSVLTNMLIKKLSYQKDLLIIAIALSERDLLTGDLTVGS